MNGDNDQCLKSREPKPDTGPGLFSRVIESWGI